MGQAIVMVGSTRSLSITDLFPLNQSRKGTSQQEPDLQSGHGWGQEGAVGVVHKI